MTIEELCERSHRTSVDKGWHENPRSMGEITALFHSEVSEALECWRNPTRKIDEVWESEGDKPEGFVIELADLMIRIGDACVELKLPLEVLNDTYVSTLGYGTESDATHEEKSIPEWLSYIHVWLSEAFRLFIVNRPDQGRSRDEQVADMLAKAIGTVGAICRINNLDLMAAIARKMDFNDSRPYRHGGKRG